MENLMNDKECRLDYGWPDAAAMDCPSEEDGENAKFRRMEELKKSTTQWPNKFDEFYLAGFNAAIHAAAGSCKRLSESAAQQDDQHGWAWAIACQSEIQKLTPEESPK